VRAVIFFFFFLAKFLSFRKKETYAKVRTARRAMIRGDETRGCDKMSRKGRE